MSYTYEINSNTGYATGGSFKAFEWVTNPPQKKGVYFAKHKTYSDIVCVEFEAGDSVSLPGHDMSFPVLEFTHWLGPIPEPEKPE